MKVRILMMITAFFSQVLSTAAQTKVAKDVYYSAKNSSSESLNIYYPKKDSQLRDVLIFIHGGSWSSGKKETYWWLGRNLAKKNTVAVMINYPLAPTATYKEMALAAAQAVKWVGENISQYGGNAQRIFLMGHSAGGHLCELINADPQYFKAVGNSFPIKGVILNDPFGLDMDEYLSKAEKDENYANFLRTFSDQPTSWKAGSPLLYVKNVRNPHLLWYGANTYPAIQIQTERIFKELKSQNIAVSLKVIPKKKHVGMISQFIFGGNKLYVDLLDFMKSVQ